MKCNCLRECAKRVRGAAIRPAQTSYNPICRPKEGSAWLRGAARIATHFLSCEKGMAGTDSLSRILFSMSYKYS